jgi:ATP-dependent helicase/nuclease subunit A
MNIVYNASAGTGKTYQVTRLYEKLVMEDGIDPREILLMTFTDNAAAELRMRVFNGLLKARKTAEQAGNYELAERAISASSRLVSAPISTIHSFCTRLLREHALEAGLSPGFSVFVGDERDELLNRICREELLARIDEDSCFKDFCSGARIIGSGKGFGTSITETVPKLIAQAGSLGISLEHAEAMLPEPQPLVSMAEFEAIYRRLNELTRRTPKVEEAMQVLKRCLQQASDPIELIGLFTKAFPGHFTLGDAKPISKDYQALRDQALDRERYRKRFPEAKAFARYVEAVAQRFHARKHEMNVIDFDDVLHATRELLETGRCATGFKYIIVDEVQDTSRIQCDLIKSLWGEETHLVICGDKKQSIYTWRGADPQVMPDLEQAIIDAGGEQRHLQTSYRSKMPILDVVNKLFTAVYGDEDYSERDNLRANPAFSTEGEKKCVEFLASDEEEELSKQEQVAAEMAAVANRIQLLIHGAAEWKPAYRYEKGFEHTGSSNTYRYSDILILLRRTTHQPALERALRHAGIPYTCGGKGSGLFSRQETRDVSLFLNVLTNPNDAYSLIGFLRSPWVGLSDEAIAELAWSSDGFSVGQLMRQYANHTDIIDRYRALLATKLASELIRMLIDETGYDALLAGLPRGIQRLANLRKVLDWLRTNERGAHTTPAAMARKLAEHIVNPPQIPEAALLDPDRNTVTIMTVHGAKGLTKRVVFIPDTNFAGNADRGFAQVYFDDRGESGLGLKITAPDKSSVKSPGFDAANGRAASVRDHESNNLFYVAMTRARDLVVTSATVGKKPAGWYRQLELLIGSDIPAIPYAELAEAAARPRVASLKPQTIPRLAAALASLPPAPVQPVLRRIAATKLAGEQDEMDIDHEKPDDSVLQTGTTSAALGSLGHAVLEQLALNEWQGSVTEWLNILRSDFAIAQPEAATLEKRIEETRALMVSLTADMTEVRPEFPFVLHHRNSLIDGTIDLLCRTKEGFSVFDYKFTESGETEAANQYRGQMEIYRRAAEKCFPHAGDADTELIMISSRGVKRVPLVF